MQKVPFIIGLSALGVMFIWAGFPNSLGIVVVLFAEILLIFLKNRNATILAGLFAIISVVIVIAQLPAGGGGFISYWAGILSFAAFQAAGIAVGITNTKSKN